MISARAAMFRKEAITVELGQGQRDGIEDDRMPLYDHHGMMLLSSVTPDKFSARKVRRCDKGCRLGPPEVVAG